MILTQRLTTSILSFGPLPPTWRWQSVTFTASSLGGAATSFFSCVLGAFDRQPRESAVFGSGIGSIYNGDQTDIWTSHLGTFPGMLFPATFLTNARRTSERVVVWPIPLGCLGRMDGLYLGVLPVQNSNCLAVVSVRIVPPSSAPFNFREDVL